MTDTAARSRDTALTAEIRAWLNVYEREMITRDEMVLEISKVLAHAREPLRPPYGILHGDRHEAIPLDDPRVKNGTRAVHLRARMAAIRREQWALQREYDAIPRECK